MTATGSPTSVSATPSAAQDGPGTYTGTTTDGARVTAEVPTDPSDPRFAKIETYRKAAGEPPYTYIAVELDNTSGTGALQIFNDWNVVTDAGSTVLFRHIAAPDGVMDRLLDPKVQMPGPVRNQAISYYNAFYDHQQVRPGAKAVLVLASTEKLPTVRSVYMSLDDFGGDELQLTRQP